MVANLDREFGEWLEEYAKDLKLSVDQLVQFIGVDEVADRHKNYPALAEIVLQSPLDPKEFYKVASKYWAMGGQFDLIKLGDFAKTPECPLFLESFLRGFPADDLEAIKRIDGFIKSILGLGFSDPKTGQPQQSIAALMTSVILSAVFPTRFVDFRQTRWKKLADDLGYDFPKGTLPYGERILAAGQFAKSLTETETFQRFWPNGEPFWTIAGICWYWQSKHAYDRPQQAMAIDTQEETFHDDGGFSEGTLRSFTHLRRERNTTLVMQAKELWKQKKSAPSV